MQFMSRNWRISGTGGWNMNNNITKEKKKFLDKAIEAQEAEYEEKIKLYKTYGGD